jgi:chromosome segregation ATPase
MKLKIDVQQSTIDGHVSQIKHLQLELKETRDLLKIYEEKCESLIAQLTEANSELNSNKRIMIGYTQSSEEKDDKIQNLQAELSTIKLQKEENDLKLGTLQIHHEKALEQLKHLQHNYDDVTDKLHKMNKARHELETKLTDEIERNRALNDIIRIKEENLMKR